MHLAGQLAQAGKCHYAECASGPVQGFHSRQRFEGAVPRWPPKSQAIPTGGRVVVFSQIRDCANVIESFVRHYAALGFYRLLLYLDDCEDCAAEVLQKSGWVEAGFVEVVPVDEALRAQWPSMPSWRRVGQYAHMEVQSRQILNNEHALLRARELGADWLLHIDSDELLWPQPAPTLAVGAIQKPIEPDFFGLSSLLLTSGSIDLASIDHSCLLHILTGQVAEGNDLKSPSVKLAYHSLEISIMLPPCHWSN
eukprot:s684_g22.t1